MRAGTIIWVVSSMITHSWGAFFFYAGEFAWIFGYGNVPPPLVMMYGISIMICGIILGIFAGKNLKSAYMVAVSLVYLIGATSWIYLYFSMASFPNRIFPFLPQILLGSVTLDVAFLTGYSRRNKKRSH